MKRWILYILIVAALAWLNQKNPGGKDLTELEPVEVIRLIESGQGVTVETDTGRTGSGKDLNAALQDMARSADKRLFLETADYLLVNESATVYLQQLTALLRPSCKVCLEEGYADIGKVAAYLRLHDPKITLKMYRIHPVPLAKLVVMGEKIYLAASK